MDPAILRSGTLQVRKIGSNLAVQIVEQNSLQLDCVGRSFLSREGVSRTLAQNGVGFELHDLNAANQRAPCCVHDFI